MCTFLRVLAMVTIAALTIGRPAAASEEIYVAVASNFGAAMQEIAARFEALTGHRVTLASGSTGKHYAQLRNGAPFAAFFAADRRRPELLEREGVAIAGTRFTYAFGRLVLWSPKADGPAVGPASLRSSELRHVAIANPDLAPYGAAARDTLQGLGLWESLQGKIVRGQNIAQAFQFVATENAELGFVSRSQVTLDGKLTRGRAWEVPSELHQPIEQQAVLVRDSVAARAFLEFIRGAEARAVIERYGYGVPDLPAAQAR